MSKTLQLYNTYTRKKEIFSPLSENRVGLYLCGPTVYGPPHLGHARSALTFDILVRYLRHCGYRTCYVRNITDVGHLTYTTREGGGEDKIAKKARNLSQHPMAVAHQYTQSYHEGMAALAMTPPNIEPAATGHIPEQIAFIEKLINKKWAYVVDGSVYFDLGAYEKQHPYGQLSGRRAEKARQGDRVQDKGEKKDPRDFALWKKAPQDHIMHWSSPWGEGFPGWHIECSVMSQKYLGQIFDIHGGGLDLCFPHHECEIAQSVAVHGRVPARYWIHNNMVTIEGKKMGKSLGNAISLQEFFSGDHPFLSRPYPPMVIRLFLLQAHYRSTVDLSDQALQAAYKNYYQLMGGARMIGVVEAMEAPSAPHDLDRSTADTILELCNRCEEALCEDLNTARLLTHLLALRKWIYKIYQGELSHSVLSHETWQKLSMTYKTFLHTILGLLPPASAPLSAFADALLPIYHAAKARGDYAEVDRLRKIFATQDLCIHDHPTATTWSYGLS